MGRIIQRTSLIFLLLSCSSVWGADYPTYPAFGSTYVPLDSWVYPAFDRLAALGYAPTAIAGLRPWTRLECARIISEATEDRDTGQAISPEASGLLVDLKREFTDQLEALDGTPVSAAGIESAYVRSLSIAGEPLTDGFHFGQTVVNDYGRPYARGENAVVGGSVVAYKGPFAFYLRGEYQHAPAPLPLTPGQESLIFKLDEVTSVTQPASTDDFRLLDTYVAFNLDNVQFSFGKQSLWWGPGESGAVLISDNVEPIYMFRVSRITPFKLPGFLHYLGPMRFELFLGKLSGHHFPARPLLHGEKLSFKPTPNLELGFSRTVVFGGVGHPLTPRAFSKSYFSVNDTPGEVIDPGDRKGGFDFSYRIPGLRNWLTIYNDSFSDDDPSPLAAPRRAAMNPGLYLSHFPRVSKLDLRGEAVYTEIPAQSGKPGTFVYWNNHYHDGYTNKGNILGSWVGRDAKGFQVWSTYWFSGKNTVQAGYRNEKVDPEFIPGGGTLNDFTIKADWGLRQDLFLSSLVQYERWRYPVLALMPQNNFTTSIQLTFGPKLLRSH